VRERLKDLLRQYELREKHIDAILRSKELELMIATAQTQELNRDLQQQSDALKNFQREVGTFPSLSLLLIDCAFRMTSWGNN